MEHATPAQLRPIGETPTAMTTENHFEIPERKRKRSLKYSIVDGCGYAAMIGFGETYFIPLLVAIGATNYQIGLFTSAPQAFVAFSQFAGIFFVERFTRRKRIVVAAAAMQSVFLLTLCILALFGSLSPMLFLLLSIVYYTVNGVGIPAWNSLIGDLTTDDDRGEYFGKRNGLAQVLTFLAVAAGGLILQYFSKHDSAVNGFAIILFAAFLSRLVSVYGLSRHYDAPFRPVRDSSLGFLQFIRQSRESNFAHFVFIAGLMTFAVQFSSPFFAVYMLRDLHFDYLHYTLAQGMFIVSQFLAMRRWGPFSDRFGNRLVLQISGTIITFIPLLWFLTKEFNYIILIQLVSGLTWAGWQLASANFIFDAVTPPQRARYAAYMNFFNSTGFCLGNLAGAVVAAHAPDTLTTGAITIIFYSPLQFIFLCSTLLRATFVFMFMPTVHEVRNVEKPSSREIFMNLWHIRPLTGMTFDFYTGVTNEVKSTFQKIAYVLKLQKDDEAGNGDSE